MSEGANWMELGWLIIDFQPHLIFHLYLFPLAVCYHYRISAKFKAFFHVYLFFVMASLCNPLRWNISIWTSVSVFSRKKKKKKWKSIKNRTTSVYWETCFLFLQRHPPSGTIRMPCSSLSCLASWAGRVWISHLDDVAYIYSTCLVSLGYRSNDKSIFTPPNQRIEGEKRGKREEKRSVLCSPWPEITQRMHELQMRFNNVLSNQPYHVALLIYDLSPFVFNPSSCDLTFSLNPSRRYFTGSHLFNLLYIYVT